MWEKLDEKLAKYEELERQMADPEIAGNHDRYTAVAKAHGSLARLALKFRRFKQFESQIAQANELQTDPDMWEMAREELAEIVPQRAALQEELIDLLLVEPDEERDSVMLEIRAGTGGEEASLFARDLYDMYRRYSEGRGWKVELIDFNASEHKGFKEVSFSVAGQDAFRELQFESGGHRVQRVPETETQGRVHTSAATVAVMAEPEEIEIDIRPEDIDMEATRSSGPGGQHVNKTSSAVRLTHIPSGMVVFCQDERSQHKNRAKAMRLLRSRLYEKMQRESRQARDALRRTLIGSGDRSERIRTYNFPQNRCTDHRLNENFNLEAIIAGDMSKLVKSLLAFDRNQRLGDAAGKL